MLNKVASWRGEMKLHRDLVFAPGAQEALGLDDPQGKLLLASHLGDVEACRALAQREGAKPSTRWSLATTPDVLSR